MAEPLEPINVLRVHLEEIYSALDWCRIHVSAVEVQNASRECREETRKSRLSVNIERALNRVEGYLVTRNDDEG